MGIFYSKEMGREKAKKKREEGGGGEDGRKTELK